MSSRSDTNHSNDRVREKRKLTPENNSKQPSGNLVKRNKKSDLNKKEMEEIQKFIAESLKGVCGQIANVQNALDIKITEMANQVSGNVKEEINTLKESMDTIASNVSNQISLIEDKLTNHNTRLDNNEDDIERITLLNQLRIVGLPFNDNENLMDFFNKLSKVIGYSTENTASMPSLRRIPLRKNGMITGSNTIIVYFNAQHYKDNFYASYLRKLPIKSEMFDQPEHVRIIIGENLTKKNAAIFNYCNTLKKEGKLAQLYSSNGLIYIKFKKGRNEKSHVIRCKQDIEILCEQNSRQSTSGLGSSSSISTSQSQYMDISINSLHDASRMNSKINEDSNKNTNENTIYASSEIESENISILNKPNR